MYAAWNVAVSCRVFQTLFFQFLSLHSGFFVCLLSTIPIFFQFISSFPICTACLSVVLYGIDMRFFVFFFYFSFLSNIFSIFFFFIRFSINDEFRCAESFFFIFNLLFHFTLHGCVYMCILPYLCAIYFQDLIRFQSQRPNDHHSIRFYIVMPFISTLKTMQNYLSAHIYVYIFCSSIEFNSFSLFHKYTSMFTLIWFWVIKKRLEKELYLSKNDTYK